MNNIFPQKLRNLIKKSKLFLNENIIRITNNRQRTHCQSQRFDSKVERICRSRCFYFRAKFAIVFKYRCYAKQRYFAFLLKKRGIELQKNHSEKFDVAFF